MNAPPHDITAAPVIEGRHAYAALHDRIIAPPTSRFGLPWLLCLGAALSATLLGAGAAAWLLYRGVGIWGVNVPVGWGIAIVNFVWWIGIGHAGTLISAILLLLRQSWRNSINRFAEAMTVFAVMNAGLFPLLHLGRIWKFYYLLPYPNQMTVWPQWRSPLVWDAFAVGTYATVSLLFWYLGLIPDLAGVRDAARRGWIRRLAGVLALGWQGSSRQWASLRAGYLVLAGLATALVVSVHSIVSLDFAVSVVPGWNPTIFPPYFVAGAIFSGMAMVLTLAIPLRRVFRIKDLVTTRHLDVMAKVMLATGLIVAFGYLMESMDEWLSTDHAERARLHARLIGHGALPFWSTIFCNVVVAQLLWFRRVRTSPIPLLLVSLVINLGMWLERYDIVTTSLERDYIPSAWRPYHATFFDWALFIGTLGLFSTLFLLFLRLLPIAPVYELKELAHERHAVDPAPDEPAAIAEYPLPPLPLVAEFASPEHVLQAAKAVRNTGTTDLEVYSPMPIDELTPLLGTGPRFITPSILLGGIVGGLAGYFLQYWSTFVNRPAIIAGKPYHSWPSFVPITYEMTILGAALAGVLAVLLSARLPRLHSPVFDLPNFSAASRDRFFLVVRSAGEGRDPDEIRRELHAADPLRVSPLATEAAT